MKVLILNGPNLNLIGTREPGIYGSMSFEQYLNDLRLQFLNVELEYRQTNSEGSIIDELHHASRSQDGIVLNAGGYSHTSIAISDAIRCCRLPVVEVHISNIYSRETYRHQSMLAENCTGVIAGFGLASYALAVEALRICSTNIYKSIAT